MCWFDKAHPRAIYGDIRIAEKGHISLRPNHSVEPDMLLDFRDLPYLDGSFNLVLFDPPHIFKRENAGFIQKKYGFLEKDSWKDDLTKGFAECFRVLKESGVLIFKWSESQIPLSEVLECSEIPPLFGNRRILKKGGTHWICFMKFSEVA